VLGIEWENVNLAGAFVIGAAMGTLATIRVMRAVLQTFSRYGMIRGATKPPAPTPEGQDEGLE
jgi:hypothetical protein